VTADESSATASETPRDISAYIAEDPATFAELLGSFYRSETNRMTAWRSRLDQTTNWAVVLVAAILTWGFSSPDHPHYVILIGIFGVSAFLLMEANRYREYDIWRNRVRTLQETLLADIFDPDGDGNRDWAGGPGDALRNPSFELSFAKALTHRLRRTYLALLFVLLAAWVARVTLFDPDRNWRASAGIEGVDGSLVVVLVTSYYLGLVALTLWSVRGTTVREFED
jgi:uncharacterized membrane protein